MQVGTNCTELVKEFESLKLVAYQDFVKVWTIGWGHTKTARKGMRITVPAAEELLRQDLEEHAKFVDKYVTVLLNQNQYDALVSFTFNLGGGSLKNSTLLKKLNAKDYAGAADEFLKWNKAGGKVLNGLTRTRERERALFLMR